MAPEATTDVPPPADGTHATIQTISVRDRHSQQHRRREDSIEPDTFAARLNRLFDTIRPPGRGPLRDAEVIQVLRARGYKMSGPYLSQLRTGSRGNPSIRTLRQLADAFGVSVEYFTEGDGGYTRFLETELRWLELAHDPDVRRITTALLALPPDAREDILRSAMSAPTVAK